MATTTNNGWETPDDTDLVKDGALAMRTLGNAIDTSVGKGLLAWQTFAPTLSAGWANGNGTWDAKYVQIGKTVHYIGQFTVGSTTTKGTTFQVNLPVTSSSSSKNAAFQGRANVAGTVYLLNVISGASGSSRNFNVLNTAGTYATSAGITATVPATWATGDVIIFGMTYEAA